MPRTTSVAVQNNFVKGLITEATALNFPENACIDTNNCIFNRNGLVQRRYSFQIEPIADSLSIDASDKAFNCFVWKDVASQGDIRFTVLQVGNVIYFYRIVQDQALSNGIHATTIDMDEYIAPDAPDEASQATAFNFSSGNGYLFVTSPFHESIYIEYDEDGDDFTANEIDIKIRDTTGCDLDTYDDDERPGVIPLELPTAHLYNLFNQGWTGKTLRKWTRGSDYKDRSDSPSNCDIDWLFKDAEGKYNFNPGSLGDNRHSTPAPKGHFKNSLYDIDRSFGAARRTGNASPDNQGYTGIAETITITDRRVAISAFFAGRVCFSGLESGGHNSKIFFSQTIEKPEQFGMCFQKNDPTSEKLFELLPTDGGYIDIIEAGTIKKLFPMMNSLLVFAANGIWVITGSQGLGFVANDYSVSKISSIEVPSETTFVDAEGTPYWWSESGIYTIVPEEKTGKFQVVNMTDATIKTFFDEIPFENKTYARGVFDPLTKTIQWLYRSEFIDSFEDKFNFDSVLNYNLLTQAFYPWTIDTSTVKLKGIMSITNFGSKAIRDNVIDGANTVIDGNNSIINFRLDGSLEGSIVKYVVSYEDSGTKVTFAESNENNSGYRDWTRVGGVDVEGTRNEAYFITGFAIKGQAIRRWQPIYVSMFSKCEEDNKYDIRGRWNFSTSSSTSRWSSMQRFTNLANDFQYVSNKFKVRGDGVSCQFEVRSVDDEPFFIVGWASLESVNKWV